MSLHMDFSRVTIGNKRPQRPWDVRLRQWLLSPETARWMGPLLASLIVIVIFAVAAHS